MARVRRCAATAAVTAERSVPAGPRSGLPGTTSTTMSRPSCPTSIAHFAGHRPANCASDRQFGNKNPVAAVIAVLITVSVSLLITRIGTTALVHTGLSREVARFQARSAFFGVGFTTSEAESVVNHPVRRRIVLWLVLLGNAGIVTVLASVVLSANAAGGITPLK